MSQTDTDSTDAENDEDNYWDLEKELRGEP